MTQQSGKHGPRLDDQLRHVTEGLVRSGSPTHAEPFKEPEPVETDDGRDPTAVWESAPRGTPPGMTVRDVEERSAMARVLAGVRYPAASPKLADHAAAQGAPDDAVAALRRLPEGPYGAFAEIAAALGYGHEARRV